MYRGRFRHQTSFLVTLDMKDFRTGCCGTRWWCTARISGSTGPVVVEAYNEISCFSDGARRERVDLCTPTARRQSQLII